MEASRSRTEVELSRFCMSCVTATCAEVVDLCLGDFGMCSFGCMTDACGRHPFARVYLWAIQGVRVWAALGPAFRGLLLVGNI